MQNKKQIGLYLERSGLREFKNNNEDMFKELEEADEMDRPSILGEIVQNNLRLIHYIIKKRYTNINQICQDIRVTYDDFFSTGYYGLMKAAYTFDLESGYKFATYATRVIHNEFGMFMRKHQRSFSVSSIYEKVHEGDRADGDITLLDMLVDEKDEMHELILEDYGFIVMDELERQLKPNELAILRMYIVDEEITQRDIAERLGISQSYISRILKRTMDKARKIYNKLDRAV